MEAMVTAGAVTDTYTVLHQIGHGAFSAVYLLQHNETKQNFALKRVSKSHRDFTEDGLLSECRIMQLVGKHANIVEFLALYESEKSFDIVQELSGGGELFDIIIQRVEQALDRGEDRPYSEKEVALILRQVVSAVAHCHANNVVHRDLKPENILEADNDGEMIRPEDIDTPLKLADFGLAAEWSTGDELLLDPCGTPEYVAPEVINRPRKGYGFEVDVWSIGVIGYILICGFPPFFGDTNAQILEMVGKAKIDFPSPEWDGVSQEAKDFVLQLCCLDPADRPTCEALLQGEWLGGGASPTARPDAFSRLMEWNAKRKFKAAVHAVELVNRVEEQAHVIKRGFLVKNKLKTMRSASVARFVVLTNRDNRLALTYHDKVGENATVKGELPLRGAKVVTISANGKLSVTVNKKLYPKHKNAGKPIFFFATEATDEEAQATMAGWLSAITAAMAADDAAEE